MSYAKRIRSSHSYLLLTECEAAQGRSTEEVAVALVR